MITFRQMMEKIDQTREKYRGDTHPDGTYVATTLTKASQKQLDDYVSKLKIPNASDPAQYHSTVIYSRKGVPEVKDYKFKLPFKAKIKEWKQFDTKLGSSGKCLVAIMDSPELEEAHSEIRREYGATHDYPDYHPHVTVSYDYAGPLPDEVPDMELEYGDVEIKPLDPQFTPAKKA